MSDVTGGTNPGVVLTGSEQRLRHFQHDREIMHADELACDLRELLRLLDEARADLARVTGERDDARRTSEYWKAEHLAGNARIDALTAKLRRANSLLGHVLIDTPTWQIAVREYLAEQEPRT